MQYAYAAEKPSYEVEYLVVVGGASQKIIQSRRFPQLSVSHLTYTGQCDSAVPVPLFTYPNIRPKPFKRGISHLWICHFLRFAGVV